MSPDRHQQTPDRGSQQCDNNPCHVSGSLFAAPAPLPPVVWAEQWGEVVALIPPEATP